MPNNIRAGRSIDPHCYHLLIVDEDCLSEAESQVALMDSIASIGQPGHNSGRDWKKILTPTELQVLNELKTAPPLNSPFFTMGVDRGQQEKEFELVQRARLRAYAREKYASGSSIWCGDGVPWVKGLVAT